ncbi:MAG: hypothetical protein A3K68_05235 [Euryarchaeota archaeon RBG_16_68_13]|nr:MAG: hypothetical protein A3K68_05235 [Euryarchaeota archaeon RBG_16_68_13]
MTYVAGSAALYEAMRIAFDVPPVPRRSRRRSERDRGAEDRPSPGARILRSFQGILRAARA